MEGVVNYYIDEPEENYTMIRGDKDVYKFQLRPAQIRLEEATKAGLNFEEKGLTFTTFPTRVEGIGDLLSDDQRILYEQEVETLLRATIGETVSEVICFDHTVRGTVNTGTRNSPAGHVHGDYDHDKGLARMRGLLGGEKASRWIDEV